MNNIYNKIKFLIDYLNKCTKAYDEGCPIISDEEWDSKYFKLKQLEEETGLIFNNSPTRSISYEVVNALQKKEHNHKMLSLDKTKSLTEVVNFINNKVSIAMCKMDGLTCSLTYENGELVSAETRGNGLVGEDILHNIKVIPSIPSKIPHKKKVTIDGEIICTYDNFKPFSDQYKNPRNFAAGSIRLLSAEECSLRNLTFVVWDIITPMYYDDGDEYNLESKLMCAQNYWGFEVVPLYVFFDENKNTEDFIEKIINLLKETAKEKRYPIDGIVFKFADCAYGRSLGETAHHFKNAIAYKFYDDVYETRLLDIEWNLGRTGVLTPIAIFDPVEIDGSEVERASLHNLTILQKTLHGNGWKGQKIGIIKSNMIIPQIVEAEETNNLEEYFDYIPNRCPVCGGKISVNNDNNSLFVFCENPNCSGKLITRLDHFCGKKGLDIKGLSKATLEKLIDWGWVNSNSDIFTLAQYKDEWIKKPGFGIKSVDKILNSISTSTECELHQFITALGIPLIGSTASKDLAKYFKDWKSFIQAIENKFSFYELPNFGTEMHYSILNFDYNEAKFIADNYIHFKSTATVESTDLLTEKIFVITGKTVYFKNRDEIKAKIEALGGKVVGSVSKNTNYLINNDVNSTSSKNITAKSLGIPILSEQDFIQTFNIQ